MISKIITLTHRKYMFLQLILIFSHFVTKHFTNNMYNPANTFQECAL